MSARKPSARHLARRRLKCARRDLDRLALAILDVAALADVEGIDAAALVALAQDVRAAQEAAATPGSVDPETVQALRDRLSAWIEARPGLLAAAARHLGHARRGR